MLLVEDTATARRLAGRAVELGRRFGVPELEMVGLGLEGQALVSEGSATASPAVNRAPETGGATDWSPFSQPPISPATISVATMTRAGSAAASR